MHNIFDIVRLIVPVLTITVLVIASFLPFNISQEVVIFPSLTLITIFYWAIYRPDLVPPVFIFLIGLLKDIGTGTPVGLMASVFLIIYSVSFGQRRFFIGKTFYYTWFGFAVISGASLFIIWVMSALFLGRVGVLMIPLMQYFLSVVIFPVVIWFFVRLQRHLVD